MNYKNILSWFTLIAGAAIIITAFILFQGNIPNNILTLNISISLFAYILYFIDILIPWISKKDSSHKIIGSLGIRWFFTLLYTLSAITAMIICNYTYSLSFNFQIIVHSSLIFILLLGFTGMLHSSEQVNQIYQHEKKYANGIKEMKTSILTLQNRMYTINDLPESFVNRINRLEENIRFISPSNTPESYQLENLFIETINNIIIALPNYTLNQDAIEIHLRESERIYQNRKNIYSN